MSSDDTMSIGGLKVMVIDDSKTIRRTAETLLKKAGCEVLTATDGFEALSMIADNNPDLIFVDVMMPRLDGLALIEGLRMLDPGWARTHARVLQAIFDPLLAMLVALAAQKRLPDTPRNAVVITSHLRIDQQLPGYRHQAVSLQKKTS